MLMLWLFQESDQIQPAAGVEEVANLLGLNYESDEDMPTPSPAAEQVKYFDSR